MSWGSLWLSNTSNLIKCFETQKNIFKQRKIKSAALWRSSASISIDNLMFLKARKHRISLFFAANNKWMNEVYFLLSHITFINEKYWSNVYISTHDKVNMKYEVTRFKEQCYTLQHQAYFYASMQVDCIGVKIFLTSHY